MQGGFCCQTAPHDSEIKAEVWESFGQMKERPNETATVVHGHWEQASDTTVLWVSQSTEGSELEEEGRKKDGGGALGPWAQKVQQRSGSAAWTESSCGGAAH